MSPTTWRRHQIAGDRDHWRNYRPTSLEKLQTVIAGSLETGVLRLMAEPSVGLHHRP
uniref:Uncharacterized protein n=1 Tax=Fagus sylvatica TaxID=28930 RepID=A0A2N9EYH8_FAGSY